jgi:hypothetical protein
MTGHGHEAGVGVRVFAAAAIVAACVLIVACGSSNQGALTPNTTTTGSTVENGAGSVASVTPQGTIIADNGFRPNVDGFSFQNYGNEGLIINDQVDASLSVSNMTPTEVANIFGTQVCANGSASGCELIPPAQAWLQQENQGMGGGHCFGFSVTALRMYTKNQQVSAYGSASNAFGLDIKGNTALQQTIAENFVGQGLPLEQQAKLSGSPTAILNKLVSALKDKSEFYTIGIFKRDGSGGHAVTPYAVVDAGGGRRGILIYDNNFPGVTRQITVDTGADTWSYDGGPNPADTNQHYEGDAKTESLVLMPLSPIERQQPCPFCNGVNVGGSSGAGTGSTLGSAQQYNEITLIGNPGNHGHLVLSDKQGHQSGFVGGQEVNDIPGVKIRDNFADQTWGEAPEPAYDVPVNMDVNVTIDGSGLRGPDNEKLDLIGPGDYNEVQDIKLQPGQQDTIDFTGDGTGYAYQAAENQTESPVLASGVQGKQADYAFVIKAINTPGGAAIDTQLDQQAEQLDLDTSGSGPADYAVAVVRQDDTGETTWSSQNLQSGSLHLQDGDKIHIDYGQSAKGQPLKLTINKQDGSTQTVELPG